MTVSVLYMGLPRPASGDDANDALSIGDMRQEILSGARHSRVIRECLEAAEDRDLHDEEMYVWLAYQALIRLEELHKTCTCPRSTRPINFDAIDGHL
jgi:hypothetical protein